MYKIFGQFVVALLHHDDDITVFFLVSVLIFGILFNKYVNPQESM